MVFISKFILCLKRNLKKFLIFIIIILFGLYLGRLWFQNRKALLEGLYLSKDGKTIVFIDNNNWYEFVVDEDTFRLKQQPTGYSYSIFDNNELKLYNLFFADKIIVQISDSQVTLTRKFPAVPCKGFESHEIVYKKFFCPKIRESKVPLDELLDQLEK